MIEPFINPLLALGNTALLGLAGAYLLGGFAKGALGFGLPLVTISILPYFIPIDMALVLNAVAILLMNIGQFLQGGQPTNTIRRCGPLLGGLMLGVPIGAALVSQVDKTQLGLLLGVFVMLFVLVSATMPRFRIPPRWVLPGGWVTGCVAGILGAITSANGPLLVMYMVGLNVPRLVFISSLALMFLVTGAFNLLAYWSIGIIDPQWLLLGLVCIVPTATGMLLGNWLAGRLSARLFRRAVLALLFVLGANLVRRAVF